MTKINRSLNERIFTVSDGQAYWSYPDGSNRCFTQEDAALINSALKPVSIKEIRHRVTSKGGLANEDAVAAVLDAVGYPYVD